MPRLTTIILVLLMTLATTLPAQTRPTTSRAARRADSLAYHHDLFLGTYARLGHHSPKWDGPVHRALESFAVDWSLTLTPGGDEDDLAWIAVQDAVHAHCDDPLFLYLAGRMEARYGPVGNHLADFPLRAARGIDATPGYPPILQAYIYLRAAEYLDAREYKVPKYAATRHAQAQKYFDQAIAIIPTLAPDTAIPAQRVLDLFGALFEVAPRVADPASAAPQAIPPDPEAANLAAFHRAFDPYAKASPDRSLVDTLEGDFLLSHAWQARGTGPAVDVPPENRDRFLERVRLAQDALERAADEDPANTIAATYMIQISNLRGVSRGTVDYWFHRATDNNPDAFDAANEVMTYLEPRWGGSIPQLLDFGRACAATHDWSTGLPLALVDAHLTAARYYHHDDPAQRPNPQYFADHPEAFAEIQPIYKEYLRRHTQSLFHHARYATLAAWSGQWAQAHEAFQALHDKTSYRWAANVDNLKKLRAQAKRHALATSRPTAAP